MFEIKIDHLKLLEGFNLDNTRDRLIAVALEMFSEHGYDKVSVRELANRADANIAAINYHFSGKKGLYDAVIEFIINYMDSWAMPVLEDYNKFVKNQNETYDIVKVIAWLEKFLSEFISWAIDSHESRMMLNKLIAREQLKPIGNMDNIYGLASIKLTEHIISDLLSKVSKLSIDDDRINIYTLSIIGQIEVFTGTNTALKEQLKIKELSSKQIEIIKELICKHVKTIVVNLTKLN